MSDEKLIRADANQLQLIGSNYAKIDNNGLLMTIHPDWDILIPLDLIDEIIDEYPVSRIFRTIGVLNAIGMSYGPAEKFTEWLLENAEDKICKTPHVEA